MAQFLTPVDLAHDSTPALLEGESTVGAPHPDVQLLSDSGEQVMATGTIVLTTLRLVLVIDGGQGGGGQGGGGNAAGVELETVTEAARDGGGPLGLGLLMPKGLKVTFKVESRAAPGVKTAVLRLAFRGEGRDQLLDALTLAIQAILIDGDLTPMGTPRSRPEVLEELHRAGSDGRLRRLIVVFENSRRPVLDFSNHPDASAQGFHHSSLLPGERTQFSDSEGEAHYSHPRDRESEPALDRLKPAGWVWEGKEWQVLTEAGRTDEEGWEHAWNFTRKFLSPVAWTPDLRESFGNKSWVRRRRWVRPCVQAEQEGGGGAGFTVSGPAGGGSVGHGGFDEVKSLLPRGLLNSAGSVSVEYLESRGGGPAKSGWLWKEGRVVKNWERRYWVLWPAEQDPLHGRLLFYFQAQDSLKPQGVIHVPCEQPGIQIRTPKTIRPKYQCRRLQCDQVVDVEEGGLQALVTAKRKIIIGADYEEELTGWTQLLRGGLDDDEASVASDHEGWLFKKNPNGIAWWKLRWFTLCGSTLKYYDSEKEHEAGEVDLTKFTLHFPNLDGMEGLVRLEHRAFEIALIPKPDSYKSVTGAGDTLMRMVSHEREPERPRFLAADDEATYTAWKAALSAVCELHVASQDDSDEWEVVAEDGSGLTTTMTQAELVESITPTGQTTDQDGVSVHHFDQLSVLGKGGFGKVLLVRKYDTKEQFAMKILLKSFIIEKKEVEHTRVERDILKEVDHPFLVKLHYAFQTPTKLYLIVDFVSGGELYFHLRSRGAKGFTDTETQFFLAELALALGHLHNLEIIYRDLKPENVLVDHDGHIKLTDFGLAKKNVSEKNRPTTFCGTPLYLAPESIKNMRSQRGYGMEVDWWTFGALMFEMLTGNPPFTAGTIQQLLHVIVNDAVQIPSKIHTKYPTAEAAILSLLQKDPTLRLGHGAGQGAAAGVLEIKSHPFFAGIDWEKLYRKELTPPFKPASSGSNPLMHFDKKMTAMKMTAVGTGEDGGALVQTASRDPFAGFGYDGEGGPAAGSMEPEPEPEPTDTVQAPPIDGLRDSSEVGVPPVDAPGSGGGGEGGGGGGASGDQSDPPMLTAAI